MSVRVIRVLEYCFPDYKVAEEALARAFVPMNGVKIVGSTTIRSATTWPEEINEAEFWNPEGADEVGPVKARLDSRMNDSTAD